MIILARITDRRSCYRYFSCCSCYRCCSCSCSNHREFLLLFLFMTSQSPLPLAATAAAFIYNRLRGTADKLTGYIINNIIKFI